MYGTTSRRSCAVPSIYGSRRVTGWMKSWRLKTQLDFKQALFRVVHLGLDLLLLRLDYEWKRLVLLICQPRPYLRLLSQSKSNSFGRYGVR